MNQTPVELINALWPNGDSLDGPQVHMLLDGARDPAIATMIRLGKLEYCCLFAGRLTPRLQAAAPYIVHLATESPLTRELLGRGWGKSWGILTVAPPHVTILHQRLHFKKFLRVLSEDGDELAFRFYDPRVLRIYLPTCTVDEFSTFFGPLTKLIVETENGAGLIEYRKSAQGMDTRAREIAAHAAGNDARVNVLADGDNT